MGSTNFVKLRGSGGNFMICPNCGHELSDHATLCPYCGSSWNHIKSDEQNAMRYCIHCGREIPVSAKFCPRCGTSCGPVIYKNSMEPSLLHFGPFSRVPASFSPPATHFTSFERKRPAFAGLFRQTEKHRKFIIIFGAFFF